MKTTKHLFLTFIACMAVMLSACSDEDGPITPGGTIPDNVLEAFNSQYPNASNVSWEIKSDYAVASFTLDATRSNEAGKNKAWYRMSDARWSMSDFDIPYSQLPQAVKTSFEASEYAQAPWHRDDDVDVITRHGYDETIYVIDVEKNENGIETDVELYYTADGILVNIIVDAEKDNDHSDMLPSTPPTTITEWIKQNFPDARIIEIDDEDGGIEVDLIANGMKHEILFTGAQQWIYTKTEYGRRNLDLVEQVVKDALKSSQHYTSDAHIDDIDRYETAEGDVFYCFELETHFDDDIDVYISITGEILSGRPSLGQSGGVAVNNDIEAFIADKYPGAVIVGKDNDDGYLEIEIRHDGLEKEVIFNGRLEWVCTKWEISRHQLPDDVANAITGAGYSIHQIDDDDIDVIETADAITYEVELEDRDDDIKLIIVNGTIVHVERD
mgnify:CR=1 FL=1